MTYNSCARSGNSGRSGCGCANSRNSGGTMRALVSCIVDSCQQCEQLTQSFEVPLADLPAVTDACDGELAVGSTVPVRQCGDLNVEVVRNNNCAACQDSATTVLLSVPFALLQCEGCSQVASFRGIVTDVKTFALQGAAYSNFELLGSEIQSLTAVVTELDAEGETARITISMLVKVYVAQTVAKEVYLPYAGDVAVSTCSNGCLNNLQVAANNVTRTGIS